MKNHTASINRIEYLKSALVNYKFLLIVTISSLLFGLSACSHNPMLVRMAYERFPGHMASELSDLANFDSAQMAWISNASKHHHNWHRKTQLPLYVNLLESLTNTIQNDRTLNLSYFETLLSKSQELVVLVNQCNPALFAAGEMENLSDQQVDQIRQSLEEKIVNEKAKYTSKNREQRSLIRFNKIKKTLSYAKLNLNSVQKILLKRTIDQQVTLGSRRFELIEQWNAEFIYILQNRQNDSFAVDAHNHIAKRWQLIEAAEPDFWSDTHTNWRNFAATLVESLTDKQRKEFGAWLSQMSRTLNTLANEKIQKTELPSPLPTACSSQA